jgi:hypothetical protein
MPAAGMATKALRESIQPPLAIPTAPPRDTTEREHRDYPQPDRQNANPPRPEEHLAEQSEHSDHRRIENDSKGDRTDDAHAPTIARVLGRLTSECLHPHVRTTVSTPQSESGRSSVADTTRGAGTSLCSRRT